MVAVPVLVAVVVAAGRTWYPAGDWALIELSARDVGSDTPLVGPFSRYGWNHPGPLLFWLLAAPYRLLGSSSWSLLVGAAMVNLASIAVALGMAWRRGRWPLLLGLGLAIALVLRGLDGSFPADPWNPYVVMLPFLVLLLAVWALTLGRYRYAPGVVLVGSFVAQTHLGYAPLVAALLGLGAVLLGVDLVARRRDSEPVPRRDLVRWLGGAAMVGVLCWLPVLVEQVTRDPGNVGQVVRHFTGSSPTPPLGVADAGAVMGRHLSPGGVWLTGGEPTDVFTGAVLPGEIWWALPALGAFAGSWWLARRADRTDIERLHLVVAVALLAGAVAVARTTGDPYPYLFQWMRPLSALLWVTVGWTVFESLRADTRSRVGAVLGPAIAGATAIAALVTSVAVVRSEVPYPEFSRVISELAGPTVDAVGSGPVLLSTEGGCWGEVGAGVALALERQGVAVMVPASEEHRFGRHRVDDSSADVQVTVACREAADARIAAGGDELVAVYQPLTDEEAAEYVALGARLKEELIAGGREDLVPQVDTGGIAYFLDSGLDPADVARFDDLSRRGQDRIAVVVGPPGEASGLSGPPPGPLVD